MNIHDLQETLVKTTKILAGKDLKVYLEGFAPRVEYDPETKKPTRIFIPNVPENAPPKLLQAIHGFIDHECSHIMFSDANDICDKSKNDLWRYIHNCIEDPRVNKAMTNHYAGSGKNVKSAYDYLFNDMETHGAPNPYSKEFVDRINLADDKILAEWQLKYSPLWFAKKMKCSLSSSKYDELDADRIFANIESKMDETWLQKLSEISTTKDVREASDYFTKFFSQEALKKMQPPPSPTGGKDEDNKGEFTDEEVKNLLKKFGISTLEEQIAEKLKHKIEDGIIKSEEKYFWTDRFDKKFNKHEIIKSTRRSGGVGIASFEEETKTVTNYLTKDLRRMLEERRRRYYIGGYKSGKLNSKSLFSVRVGNDRIFKKKNEIRDVNAAVSLLVDMSGSMCGNKIKIAMQSAYAFAMTLEQLKVPYEIYGFQTDNGNYEMANEYRKWALNQKDALRRKVVNQGSGELIYAFKEFNETFDRISKEAMVTVGIGGISLNQNEDSKHVMLALHRLSVRPEPNKVLFVFSDGVPCFNTSSINLSYDNLKYYAKVAKEKFGVNLYSIGILSDSVKNFYSNWKIVNRLSDVPKALFEFLRKSII